ncbi:two-component regulator propeller domain-containing protein [Pedobacter frigiditerrae]|uniref:hybrid sensor histidine kinase/response regulator transcription factor n=1 Tax=Pedobacter frigiditerrae TaxID=2530452 RepID=UPI00292E995F|nr:two-component regulator propeller domain-containing protein [Pedobacter frigiditerrae]
MAKIYSLKSIIGFVYLFFTLINCSAQLNGKPIKYLGVEDGLSNNVVNSLYQDRFGFMWMGTYDGLNRYDGYSFKIFRNKWGDENSLINNHITALNGDDVNRIWIGTQKGVSFFDYANSKIHPVFYIDKGRNVKITAPITSIAVAKNGTTYIATDEKGLFVIQKGSNIAQRIPVSNHVNYTARGLAIDEQNNLWVFVKDVGLCTYHVALGKIGLTKSPIHSVTSIINFTKDELFIGTEKGLFSYHKATGKLERIPAQLSDNNIMSLSIDLQKKLWIATDGGGITIIDLATKKSSFLNASKEKGMLSSNSIGAVYEDREARKWIATLRGGVNIIDNVQAQFRTIKKDPFRENTLVNNFILSFCEDENKNIWIGTDGGGLSLWNPITNRYTNFVHHQNDPTSLSSNFITSILNDKQQNIWVTTFNGGIDRFNKQTNSFKHYTCFNTVKKIEEINVWKIFQDKSNRLWAGTTKGGALYLYNSSLDKFELFDARLKDIHTLYQDAKGILWGGNYTHLIQIDPIRKKHQYIPVGIAIRAIYEDSYKQLWIGTEGGGMLKLDRKTKKLKRYIQADGLPSNSVLNILEDNKGNLWCSTYNGLSRFNIKTAKFKNYYATDGLQSNQFNYNAALRLSNGELLFGGINGFNKFFPDSIKINKRIPKIVITDFRVNNIPIDEDPAYQDEISVVGLDKISMPFNAAVISVNFSAIEFSFQDQIKYAYYLEGWDRDWNYIDKLNFAYYSRLNEGTYKLHLKSTDTEGAWAANEKIIIIKVLPPWYRTWWAYSLYIALMISLYAVFVKYRRRQYRLKHEVELANLNREREKELNEKKLNFFTNISHELRTPLTLIVNPIKDILSTKENGQEKNDLNVVYRNSRRLLSLVDQLLLFRKTENENEALKLVKINLFKFAHEIFVCFNYLANNNNISYKFECEDEQIYIYADRDKLEIILFNLLSNALKFTPKGGKVVLNIALVNEMIQIRVADTGPGIPIEVGDKLFDKFYKVINNSSIKIGFGIGLYLVKNFVELHQGKISYTSTLGEGTTFFIALPKGDIVEEQLIILEDKEELNYVNELITEEDELGDEQIPNLELLISDLHAILVVDDNEQIIDYIHQIFHQKFKVYKANNGLEGLAAAREHLPDIIISDVNMDGLDGIELCREIKADPTMSHIPVILLTADPSPELRLQGIEVGAYDFISKPFDKELFTAKINGVIKNRSNLQSYFYNEVTLKSERNKISQEDKSFIQKTITIIEDNLMETNFNVKILASQLSMSHSNLYKRIKATSGLSINSFVRFIRLRKAAELLINTGLNINEVAFRVGINDIKYFRVQFQNQFKLTPSAFIKKHRKIFHKQYSINTNLADK